MKTELQRQKEIHIKGGRRHKGEGERKRGGEAEKNKRREEGENKIKREGGRGDRREKLTYLHTMNNSIIVSAKKFETSAAEINDN